MGGDSTGLGRVIEGSLTKLVSSYASDLRCGKQNVCLNLESTLCHSENEKLAFSWFTLRA